MSLVGFTLLGTIEVPSITGSATAVPLLVKPNTEFTTDMLAALDSGGGDLRFGTEDGTTQYPCEIVDGLDIVWMTPTGLSVASAATVGVWGDNTGASQPAAGAAFGRNAVWVNSAISSHLTESSGTVATDSAGNRNGAYNGALPTVGANFGQDLNGTTDYVNFGNAALGIASAFTFSLKVRPDTIGANQQLFTSDDSNTGNRHWQWRINANGTVAVIPFDSSGAVIFGSNGPTVLVANTEYILNFSWTGAAYKVYINGAEDLSVASTTNIADLTGAGFGAAIGARNGASIQDFFNGQAENLDVIAGAFKTADQISIEYNNQATAGSWWIAADAGGGIVIAPTSIPSGESFGTPTITTGIVIISPVAIPTQESVGSPTILKELFISPVTIPSEESVGDPVIELILQQIFPNGIPTEEFVGRPIVLGGDSIVIPVLSRQTWNAVAKYLRDLVFKGHDNDVIVAWLRSEGFEDGAYNDLWYDYLLQKGFIDGSLTDKYAAWRQDIAGDDPWILSSGSWNDNKIWRDNENWKDS
jgi:hypothetical protein